MTPNIDALKVLRDMIDSYPDHFDMDDWFYDGVEGHSYDLGGVDLTTEEVLNSCGTTACIAGWAKLLLPEMANVVISHEIADFLGISHAAFFKTSWPSRYAIKFETQAEQAIALIDDIINGNDPFPEDHDD